MFGMSLSFKILMGLLLIAGIAITTAKFTHDFVADEYQNKELTRQVAVVTREKTIAVADTQALADQKAAYEKRLKAEQKTREELNAIIAGHKDSTVPWCGLSPYELCVWNRENRYLFQNDSSSIPECAVELPSSAGGDGRDSGKPLEK